MRNRKIPTLCSIVDGVVSKLCTRCGQTKSVDQFNRSSHFKSGYNIYCKPCRKSICAPGKPRQNLRLKRQNRTYRQRALLHYGGECACCGEDRYEFLAIDHEHGGGNQHRKKLKAEGKGGSAFPRWLFDQGYPEGFRVLCHNCNSALGYYGYCPHKGVPLSEGADPVLNEWARAQGWRNYGEA